MTNLALEGKGDNPNNAAANVAEQLYPSLLKLARAELLRRDLDRTLAEDLVQSAVAKWLGTREEDIAYVFMRNLIRNAARNQTRPGRDAMTRNPLSLEAFEE